MFKNPRTTISGIITIAFGALSFWTSKDPTMLQSAVTDGLPAILIGLGLIGASDGSF